MQLVMPIQDERALQVGSTTEQSEQREAHDEGQDTEGSDQIGGDKLSRDSPYFDNRQRDHCGDERGRQSLEKDPKSVGESNPRVDPERFPCRSTQLLISGRRGRGHWRAGAVF